MKFLFSLFLCISLLGCKSADDGNEPINCTEQFVFGLTVQVRDIDTGGIILNNIVVTATDGNYSEELAFNFDRFIGAGEREGAYTLTVEADGYLTLISPVITVGADECHVIGQFVELNLERL